MWQSDKRYFTKSCVLAGLICFSVPILTLIFGLFFDAERDAMMTVVGGWLLIFVCCLVYGLIRVVLEHRLIRLQTSDYGLRLLFEAAKPLYPNSLHFLGANVMIWAGRAALHRSFISEMLVKPGNKYNDLGGRYCRCSCPDGQTIVFSRRIERTRKTCWNGGPEQGCKESVFHRRNDK